MKPGEKDLYVFLMHESERYCTREITVTDATICEVIGTAPRTLCNARKRLQERGLIRHAAGRGNRYTYTICNPKTREPYPGQPRDPARLPKKEGTPPLNKAVRQAEQQQLLTPVQGLSGVFR